MNEAVYEKLIQVARDRGLITYKELGLHVELDISYPPDMDELILALEQIADHETAAGRPLLVALVVREDTKMSGGGLHKYAKKNGLQPKKMDNITFFLEEINRIYQHWQN